MKKYLLVVFGDFKSKKLIESVGKGLSPIVDTPHLKFQYIKGALIMHFGSEVSQEEIHDFLTGFFYGLSEIFILTEMTDKVSFSMSDETRAHLLDLENDGDNVQIKIDMSDMRKSEFDDELTEDFVNFLLDEFNEEIKVPSLNDILDKINEKGIKSLSAFEKEILDNYSKK
jgi:hypothetical protein